MDTQRRPPSAEVLLPVVARHETPRKQQLCSIRDCVRFFFVREGTILVRLGKEAEPFAVSTGTSLLIAPGTDFGYQPEGAADLTTLLIDTDYLIEHLFWQHFELIPDRDAARDLAAKLYPDPVQMLRLGERKVERLRPILDELVTRTETGQGAAGYFRTHAVLLTVLEAMTPHVHHVPVEIPPLTSHQRVKRIAPPPWRAYRPIRREAALAAALMQDDMARPWRLADLTAHVCLSPSQFANVFTDAFAVTPHTYLLIVRTQRMAKLVRETDQPITSLYRQVGWHSRGHAAVIFRHYLGVNPSEYRRYGPPDVSQNGPGIGVAQAAINANESANESAKQPVGRGIAVELSTGHMP